MFILQMNYSGIGIGKTQKTENGQIVVTYSIPYMGRVSGSGSTLADAEKNAIAQILARFQVSSNSISNMRGTQNTSLWRSSASPSVSSNNGVAGNNAAGNSKFQRFQAILQAKEAELREAEGKLSIADGKVTAAEQARDKACGAFAGAHAGVKDAENALKSASRNKSNEENNAKIAAQQVGSADLAKSKEEQETKVAKEAKDAAKSDLDAADGVVKSKTQTKNDAKTALDSHVNGPLQEAQTNEIAASARVSAAQAEVTRASEALASFVPTYETIHIRNSEGEVIGSYQKETAGSIAKRIELQVALERAKAELEAAQKAYEIAKAALNDELQKKAELETKLAQAEADLAQAEANKSQKLADFTSKSEAFTQQEQELATAIAALDKAKAEEARANAAFMSAKEIEIKCKIDLDKCERQLGYARQEQEKWEKIVSQLNEEYKALKELEKDLISQMQNAKSDADRKQNGNGTTGGGTSGKDGAASPGSATPDGSSKSDSLNDQEKRSEKTDGGAVAPGATAPTEKPPEPWQQALHQQSLSDLETAKAILRAIGRVARAGAGNSNPMYQIAKNLTIAELGKLAQSYLESAAIGNTLGLKPTAASIGAQKDLIFLKFVASQIIGEATANVQFWKQQLEEIKNLHKQSFDLAKA